MSTVIQQRSALHAGEFETIPVAIPINPETIFVSDAHILEIHLVGGAADASVTINDGHGIPVIPIAITVKAGTDLVWEFSGRLAKGGITWSASANTVTGYVRWVN